MREGEESKSLRFLRSYGKKCFGINRRSGCALCTKETLWQKSTSVRTYRWLSLFSFSFSDPSCSAKSGADQAFSRAFPSFHFCELPLSETYFTSANNTFHSLYLHYFWSNKMVHLFVKEKTSFLPFFSKFLTLWLRHIALCRMKTRCT